MPIYYENCFSVPKRKVWLLWNVLDFCFIFVDEEDGKDEVDVGETYRAKVSSPKLKSIIIDKI